MTTPAKPPAEEFPAPPPADRIVVAEQRIRRLSWSVVGDAILGAFNAERGFFYTMHGFVKTPRAAFEGYLGEERRRYSNPIKMVVFLSALTAFLMHQLQAFELVQLGEVEQTVEAEQVAAFMQRNYNLLLLSALPLMAVLSRLFYWGRVYNLVEHLALNAFQVSVITVAYIIMLPIIMVWPIMNLVYMVLALIYQVWLYRRVLGPGWFRAVAATVVVTIGYLGVINAIVYVAVIVL